VDDNNARGWQAYLCYGLTNSAHKYVLGNLTAAYAWAGREREAKDSLAKLSKLDANYMGAYQSVWDANDNPNFRAELGRVMEGLRKAAPREGDAKSN
jgi:hypothetical protein